MFVGAGVGAAEGQSEEASLFETSLRVKPSSKLDGKIIALVS